jgi:hypothetical protein
MRRAGCWRRLAWCSGEEGSRSSRGWRHVQFSKTEVGANVGEGGEGPLASDDVSHEQEPLVEAPQNVEHEGPVIDRFTEVGEGVSHALQLATVVVDGEVSLGQIAELSIKEQSSGLTVPKELLHNSEPGSPGRDAIVRVDDVQELGGDAVEDPRHDHTIHALPVRVSGTGNVAEDMVLERVPAEGK